MKISKTEMEAIEKFAEETGREVTELYSYEAEEIIGDMRGVENA